MARYSETFSKKEKEKKKLQKRKEKEERKEERKANKENKSFEDMLAYVDENGNLSATPPDPSKKKVTKESDIDLTPRNKEGAVAYEPRKGFVKFFNPTKGFGFIKEKATSEEFFFHYKAADFAINQNDQVTFDVERGQKGLNAVNISKAPAPGKAAPASDEASAPEADASAPDAEATAE